MVEIILFITEIYLQCWGSYSANMNSLKTIDTTFEIIQILKREGGTTASALSDELDLPISTVYSHLNSLEHNEYIVKNGTDYRIGLRFLELGEQTKNRISIFNIAESEIEALATETGELANLGVLEHGYSVCLCKKKGHNAVRLDTFAGKRVPMHCSGMGKAILAHLDREKVHEILDKRGLEKMTEFTITDREELFSEFEAVREEGFAYDMEEYNRGMRCVAKPILTDDDNVIGAVSVSGPTSRLDGETLTDSVPTALENTVNIIEVNYTHTSR